MATAYSTRRSAGPSLSAQPDEFGALLRRLLVSVNHVALVSQQFGDLSDLPPEHVPAGMTLHMAAQDLDRLYDELDAWNVRYEHLAKPLQTSELGIGPLTSDSPTGREPHAVATDARR